MTDPRRRIIDAALEALRHARPRSPHARMLPQGESLPERVKGKRLVACIHPSFAVA